MFMGCAFFVGGGGGKGVYLEVKYLIYYVIQIYPAQSFRVGIVICLSAKVRHRLLISVIKWGGFKWEHTDLKLHAQKIYSVIFILLLIDT